MTAGHLAQQLFHPNRDFESIARPSACASRAGGVHSVEVGAATIKMPEAIRTSWHGAHMRVALRCETH